MQRRWIRVLLLAGLAFVFTGQARAAGYAFLLPKEVVNVFWQADGTANLDYVFTFANDSAAHPIDYVDVGLPTSDYSLTNITADVDGHPITDIQVSTYVKVGVALGLGPNAIAPGATGSVHALIRGVGQVLYPDSQNSAYASAVFSPTWFDPSLAHGQTDLTVVFHLPPGVQPGEPRYHTAQAPLPAQPDAGLDSQGQVTYTWHAANANASTQYTVGASFPKTRVAAGAVVVPTSGAAAGSTSTLPYLFQVKALTSTIDVLDNGAGLISYDLVLANDPASPPLDRLELTLPDIHYDNTLVKVNGQEVSATHVSGTGNPAVVNLGQSVIAPGAAAAVEITFTGLSHLAVPDSQQVGNDTTDFSPPRFSSKQIHGVTDLTAEAVLPESVTSATLAVRSAGGLPFRYSGTDLFGAIYTWHKPDADISADYALQISFPASAIVAPAAASTSSSSRSSGLSGLISIVGVILAVVVAVERLFSPQSPLAVNKLDYLPPTISIEGNGIKRGLTAIEAAVLREESMDRVLTMILFAVLKKGAATVTVAQPLTLEAASPRPEGLYEYERDFLDAMQKPAGLREVDLQAALVRLVNSVSEKMRGFSRSDTTDYYQSILEKAWQDVQAADTPEVKAQKVDDLIEWAPLDPYFEGRLRMSLGPDPLPLPAWWGRYAALAPSGGNLISVPGSLVTPVASAAPTTASITKGGSAMPTLPGADFAASIANGVQNFSSQMISNVERFTAPITAQTNPQTSSSSGGHYSGGHCACACACAGCACACAGGGR